MSDVQNVLFIMADQLRADHLSCYGHPYLQTPSLDALAAHGVRFDRAFVNSGVCGPSRMSYYTGRYPSSHGATWNRVPLSVNEITLGEYLAGQGRELALAGKTHIIPDKAGMERLSIDGSSELGALLGRGGFTELDRYDGHHTPGDESGYPAFLRRHGYDSADPWTDYVIAAVDAAGQAVSGWNMRNAHLPARVAEPHSETAYMTDQALDFMKRRGSQPWVLHLSYVKPHWPYMAPDPYHKRYTPDQCLPVRRNREELENAHPVVAAYRQHEESVSFSSDECVRVVRPAYQGLIRQLDDHLGRLFDYMEGAGLMKNTLIVFTADHGDFLGDHWLGEKELFYDTVQRVPFIVMDPSAAADATRGRALDDMVESVDLAPTVLRALGKSGPGHRLEGRELQALLHGRDAATPWRDCVYSELDYSFRQARLLCGKTPQNARAWSVRTDRWRYVYWLDEREQLFDLHADPEEFQDLGASSAHAQTRQALRQRLLEWMLRGKRRTTISDEAVEKGTNAHKRAGVYFGQW
ncbi:sulfatase-like hydrolase/transferase [Achromobacter xylosoxidans]|uniref:Phosphonate monoester hydrolase n=1 Tax=Alcaligenes xylosoxydans xylosoxydans TaxID=85698 RepID=A0A424W7X8_ALCXX|nr:sulfatase-like hydrolase/transferase [Achromobacter xylosoxidans]MBC9907897.1 sulfatase-like hydrolase/transferase [Achromobacter xylosoxidans]MBD0871633.1 sulfatase-like hydrolase/transferase [Achromobacter xylosoxidans]QNP87903.1 sulfatase-like hydrolase/transferase [Achromobacter xylosoxidans]RPJ89406.1 phosphonate monoester hydrolase [Achromobacter xylosoxidans]